MSRTTLLAAAAGISLGLCLSLTIPTGSAQAAQIVTPAVLPSGEIGARIRWGATGWEAAVLDFDPLNSSTMTNLNPSGSPVWSLNQPYAFQIEYSVSTGAVTLSVDFNRDDAFGVGEVATRSTFALPGLESYAGLGFEFLSISGNESGSTGRSALTELTINGVAQASIVPDGGFTQVVFAPIGGGAFEDVIITGNITFLTMGTAQERPSWNFTFRSASDNFSAETPVPEPATLGLLGLGLAGLAFARRRRRQTGPATV